MDKVADKKLELRKAARLRRRLIGGRERAIKSIKVQEHLMSMPEFLSARRIGLYLAVRNEVETGRIIRECRQRGIRVCVPVYRPRRGDYAMAWFDAGMELVKAWKGLPEPRPKRWVRCSRLDVMIVPGVAFDRYCGRLGQGGGYYDRLLAGPLLSEFKVGLAFEAQIVRRLPMDKHDIKMDAVVTEKRILRDDVSARSNLFSRLGRGCA